MPLSWIARVTTFIAANAAVAACAGTPGPIQPPSYATAGAPLALGRSAHADDVLYSFTGQGDGGDPSADLVFAGARELLGTTVVGGGKGCGTLFALTHTSHTRWKERVVYSFTCYASGKNPYGGVLLDPAGNAYGTTVNGGSVSCGSTGCGVAFRLRGSSETVLHDFTGGADGLGPGGAPAADARGGLFGTTPDGGKYSEGVVYELLESGGRWSERVIHAFTGGSDGGTGSLGRLLVDDTGVYGVAETGGAYGAGTAFRMTHARGTGWTFVTLYSFKGTPDCGSPYGGLVKDRHENLFGTTYYGGASGLGCIYELVAGRGYAERILHSFAGGNDGSMPTSTLWYDGASELYGTTSAGGDSCDCGTAFALNPRSSALTILHAFTGGSDGAYPYYGLVPDSAGYLYGATAAGGTSNDGVVYRVKPAGRR